MAEQDANPDFTLVDDMILAPEQYDVLYNDESRRTGLMQAVRTWPNATVPYLLDNNFSRTKIKLCKLCFLKAFFLFRLAASEKSLIRAAMNIVQKGSCVKFLRIQDTKIHKDYVHIQPGHGCASTVGFWGGKQIIYLQKVVKTSPTLHLDETFYLTSNPQIKGLHGHGSDSSRAGSRVGIFSHAHSSRAG